MKNDNRFLTALLIVIPVVALGIISIGPYPIEMVSIWQKARLAAAQQKYTLAADLYKQLVIYQPERTDLWNTIGDLEFQGENYTDAVTAYQKAEQANVITEKGLFNLGFSFQEEEQSQLALNAWRRLIGWPGLESGQYSHLVEILRGEGDFESALQAAKAWNDHYPHDEQAAYNYGILLAYKDPERSSQIMQSIIQSNSSEAKNAEILITGLDASIITDQREYGLVVFGQSLLQIHALDLAEQAFVQATLINPTYAEAWALLSEVEQSLGKDGWQSLQKARELNPNSDIVRAELALYYRRQSMPDEALSVLRELSSDNPYNAGWVIEIGSTLAEQGDLIAAMNAFEQATELEPTNPVTWRALATFAAQNGFDAQSYSIPAAEKALALNAKDAQSLDCMGWIWLIEGDLEKAEQFLQQAIKQDASNPRTALHLGQLYLEMNRLQESHIFLNQAANQEEDLTVALQAGRLLEKYFSAQP